MNPQNYSEQILVVEGWQVRLTTYQLGDTWHSKADNVSPGASLARMTGATRDEAEQKALERARQLLGRTQRRAV